jgi:hypothetical protein
MRRVKIRFQTSEAPYSIVDYLEGYGIPTWITSDIKEVNADVMEAVIEVNPKQYKFALGLVAGFPNTILIGAQAKPIKPSSSWGSPNRAHGFLSDLIRTFAPKNMGKVGKT